MGFLEIRSSIKWLNPPDARRRACIRSEPECVVLPVAEGVSAVNKPPVRVFLGTEPGQYRAERIFVYSIEKNRNPARVYEIHLMKDLAGFDRRGWTTGFTNYRFAVPHLAGREGRAIFNDVDEAYFGDPADLFDADMGGHGYLATSQTETSVMLIDCERMAPVWPLEWCQYKLKKQLLARTLAKHPDIRGDLPPEWTARDDEFVPGFSKLQHWTTLQTQPWRPVPGRFVYQPNLTGSLWFDLEEAADAAGYQVFSDSRPSSLYRGLLRQLRGALRPARAGSAPARAKGERLDDVIERVKARSVLDYGLARSADGDARQRFGLGKPRVSSFDLMTPRKVEPCDGVVCEGVLEWLPDEDVAWVVDDLFERSRRFVYAVVENEARGERLCDGSKLESHLRDPSWWIGHFESAARRHPERHWTLVLSESGWMGRKTLRVRDGGHRYGSSPNVWVLSDERQESSCQALALADALGWPYQHKKLNFAKKLSFGRLGEIAGRLLGASTAGLDHANASELAPPWPDVVISAGGHCVPVALWIRERDHGRTRLVHVGCDGGEWADPFDAVVTPSHARLWPHPKRIETAALLIRGPAKRLARSPARAREPFGDLPQPHVTLLLDLPGGSELSPDAVRRMGQDVRGFAEREGGSVRAVAGAGIGPGLEAALAEGIGDTDGVRSARPPALREVVADFIDAADVVVVAGNDESLVSEAVGYARPVYIYPLGHRCFRPAQSLRESVMRLAHSRADNARGTPRPQQGIEYLAARLIERGIVRPPRDVKVLHQNLYERNVALPFGAPLRVGGGVALREAEAVSGRVRDLLGYGSQDWRTHV
jgi:mitochondrial fission protein ELM1